MKLNKIILPVMVPVIAATGFSITSCNKTKFEHTSMFNKTNGVADTVYVVTLPTENKNQWYVTIQSLQGILAQTKAQIFINTDDTSRNVWLQSMQEKMGFKTVPVMDPIELLNKFSSSFNKKYVLYKDPVEKDKEEDLSIDKATTIAAAENAIMISETIVDDIEELEFEQIADASELTTREVFDTYKDKLNNAMLFNQRPSNLNLRDYAISSKCFTTYMEDLTAKEAGEESSVAELKKDILAWAEPNCPILGWNRNEVNFVQEISQYSKVITPSDHCTNLSFTSAYTPSGKYTQKHQSRVKPQKGKHYVAIVMSDGDNIQWLQSDFTLQKYFGNQYRGEFPLTWTLSPGPYDVEPAVLDKIYSMQSDNDNFICGPSGYGYINYDTYGQPDEFAKHSADYMNATDMRIVNFIDFESKNKNPDAFNHPFAQDQIKGGVWAFGNWYIEGQGGVYWRKDKPVIAMREGLWRIEDEGVPRSEDKQFLRPDRVAERINSYPTDPTSIEGYTIVSAHVWSFGQMDYVKQFVKMLDDHVQLVTAEQLVNMVIDNVPHVDVEATSDNGWKHRSEK